MKLGFKKRLWMSIGIILGSVALASFGLYYFSGNLAASAAQLINNRARAQADEAALDKLAELKQDAPIAASYETAMNTLLPTQNQLLNFQPWLTALASTDGVSATFAFQGNPQTPAAGMLGNAPFSLNVQGSQTAVVTFMQDFEYRANGSLLSINSFDATSDGNGNVTLIAQGTIYFQGVSL